LSQTFTRTFSTRKRGFWKHSWFSPPIFFIFYISPKRRFLKIYISTFGSSDSEFHLFRFKKKVDKKCVSGPAVRTSDKAEAAEQLKSITIFVNESLNSRLCGKKDKNSKKKKSINDSASITNLEMGRMGKRSQGPYSQTCSR
jgi:hypothetical protein